MPQVRLDLSEQHGGGDESDGADIRIDTDVFRALSAVRAPNRQGTVPRISRWFDCWRSRLRD